MKKKWLAAILVYAALVIICIIAVYIVPSLRGMLEKTYVTEYGRIDITDDVSGFIVRDETVYVADEDSKIDRVAEEGILLKANSRIVDLEEDTSGGTDTPSDAVEAENIDTQDNISDKYADVISELDGVYSITDNGRSNQSGYVSYSVDGTESRYGTDRLFNLTQEDLDALKNLDRVETPSKSCGKGEPVFKIIHNSKWYLVCFIDNKAGEKYYEGRSVSIDIDGKDVPAKVAGVEAGKKTTKIILSCKAFYDGFADTRILDTTITFASSDGLMLKDSSIVKKGDQIGVFVKNKLGEHRFKPISIKADDGERCVVFSDIYVDENGNFVETVNTYDEIVAEPTEEEVAELQEQLKREKEEAARQKEEAEKAAAEKAAEEKAAEERAKERAEAEQEAIEKQKAAAGEKPTESSTETTSKPSEPTETEVGTPQEDGAGDYTEDVSSEEEGAATAD